MLEIQELQNLCLSRNISIAVAESCTAGLIASKITSTPGSSAYFKGGIVAYQNEIKIQLLGVTEELINNETEVSHNVVSEMASNTLSRFNVDFSIATSGYAGPGGGAYLNPIGTVFIAVSNSLDTVVKKYNFIGNREEITNQATVKAIQLLLSQIKKYK